MPYTAEKIRKGNKKAEKLVDLLLEKEGIERDRNLEYTVGLYNGEKLIGTGSYFGNTLRCIAIDSAYQGEGLLGIIVSHLLSRLAEKGIGHVFLYTKWNKGHLFESLGFFKVANVENTLVFMENRRDGFERYLADLERESPEKREGAAVVMNANPFTKGHLYLVEKAAEENELVHLFIVSEDKSLVPYEVRKRLIKEGLFHLKNIVFHDTGSYMISSATFPSYFLKDSDSVSLSHAELDTAVFSKIAHRLGIVRRYAGEEKRSRVTDIYNRVMEKKLPEEGIECIVVPRKEQDGGPISASDARKAIKEGDFETLQKLVPKTTLDFFMSEKAKDIIDTIKTTENVIHH